MLVKFKLHLINGEELEVNTNLDESLITVEEMEKLRQENDLEVLSYKQ